MKEQADKALGVGIKAEGIDVIDVLIDVAWKVLVKILKIQIQSLYLVVTMLGPGRSGSSPPPSTCLQISLGCHDQATVIYKEQMAKANTGG